MCDDSPEDDKRASDELVVVVCCVLAPLTAASVYSTIFRVAHTDIDEESSHKFCDASLSILYVDNILTWEGGKEGAPPY